MTFCLLRHPLLCRGALRDGSVAPVFLPAEQISRGRPMGPRNRSRSSCQQGEPMTGPSATPEPSGEKRSIPPTAAMLEPGSDSAHSTSVRVSPVAHAPGNSDAPDCVGVGASTEGAARESSAGNTGLGTSARDISTRTSLTCGARASVPSAEVLRAGAWISPGDHGRADSNQLMMDPTAGISRQGTTRMNGRKRRCGLLFRHLNASWRQSKAIASTRGSGLDLAQSCLAQESAGRL